MTPSELQRFIVHPLPSASSATTQTSSNTTTTIAATTAPAASSSPSSLSDVDEAVELASVMTVNELKGMMYNPLNRQWKWDTATDCNYIVFASRHA